MSVLLLLKEYFEFYQKKLIKMLFLSKEFGMVLENYFLELGRGLVGIES